MTQFHIGRDGKQFGPYEDEQARLLYAQGGIVPTDLVWREGMAGWQPAAEIFGPPPTPSGVPPLPFGPPTMPVSAPRPAYTAPVGLHASPMPPKLHWGLVLLFSVLTLGIFAIVWMFLQSGWVRRIDPSSKATTFFAAYLVLTLVSFGCTAAAMNGSQSADSLGNLCEIAAFVVFLFGAFSIRRSMVTHFNTVEPIGLRMSGVMVFFFNILYFQHHMTRIAEWKTTGVIHPQ